MCEIVVFVVSAVSKFLIYTAISSFHSMPRAKMKKLAVFALVLCTELEVGGSYCYSGCNLTSRDAIKRLRMHFKISDAIIRLGCK